MKNFKTPLDAITFLSKDCNYISTSELINILGVKDINNLIDEGFIERIVVDPIDLCYFGTKRFERYKKLEIIIN